MTRKPGLRREGTLRGIQKVSSRARTGAQPAPQTHALWKGQGHKEGQPVLWMNQESTQSFPGLSAGPSRCQISGMLRDFHT